MVESMSLAIVRRTDDELMTLADRLSQSTLLPKQMQGKMADVLVTIMAGQEMGLAPMASLRAFHVIEGKPVLSSDGMAALVISSGKAQYFDCIEATDKSVTYETLRVGSKAAQRCTWTFEMAKTAALHQKDNWRLYPRQMLASRAKSELARRVYPDVLMGCFTEDEIDSTRARASSVVDVVDADFTEATAEPEFHLDDYPEISAMETAPSVAVLKELAGTFAARKLGSCKAKDEAEARYRARMTWLKSQPVEQTAAAEVQP